MFQATARVKQPPAHGMWGWHTSQQHWVPGGYLVTAEKVQIHPCVCKHQRSANYGPWAQGGPPANFVNEAVLQAATPTHLHIISGCFCTGLNSAVRTETRRPTSPKIFTVWTFTERVLSPGETTGTFVLGGQSLWKAQTWRPGDQAGTSLWPQRGVPWIPNPSHGPSSGKSFTWRGPKMRKWLDLMCVVPIRRLSSSSSPCTGASARTVTSVTSTWGTNQRLRACDHLHPQTEAAGFASGARPAALGIELPGPPQTPATAGHQCPRPGGFFVKSYSQHYIYQT